MSEELEFLEDHSSSDDTNDDTMILTILKLDGESLEILCPITYTVIQLKSEILSTKRIMENWKSMFNI